MPFRTPLGPFRDVQEGVDCVRASSVCDCIALSGSMLSARSQTQRHLPVSVQYPRSFILVLRLLRRKPILVLRLRTSSAAYLTISVV